MMHLQLFVIRACALRAANFHHDPKARVTVQVDSAPMIETSTAQRSKNPSWNEKFTLVAKDEGSVFTLKIFHNSRIGVDVFLGGVEIAIGKLLQQRDSERQVTLSLGSLDSHSVISGGEITIRLREISPLEAGATASSEAGHNITAGALAAPQLNHALAVMTAMAGQLQRDAFHPLGAVLAKMNIVSQMIGQFSKIHPYLNVAWQVLSSIYKAVQGQVERDQKLLALFAAMQDAYSVVEPTEAFRKKIHTLEILFQKIIVHTTECAMFIREYCGHGFGGRLVRQAFSAHGERIDALSNTFGQLKKSFLQGTTIQIALTSFRILDKVEEIDAKITLQLLKPADMDFSSRPECLSNTRTEAIRYITDWATAGESNQNVLWIRGMAGVGKSTVATTVANIALQLRRLGAFVFHDPDNTQTHHHPIPIVRTIAHQLSLLDPRMSAAISDAVKGLPGCIQAPVGVQFQKLLVQPLSSEALKSLYAEGSIIIVIDALDEYGPPERRKDLLSFLAKDAAKLPTFLRILVTSRDEQDISTAFHGQSHILQHAIQATPEYSSRDIQAYFRYHMMGLRTAGGNIRLDSDWPDDDSVRELADLSSGLFIWASSAMAYIGNSHHPQSAVETLLRKDGYRTVVSLDRLYKKVLRSIGNWNDEEFVEDFRRVLGVIMVARIPLSASTIDSLLDQSHGFPSANHITSRFASVLRQHPAVTTIHPSLSNYITNAAQCAREKWFIDLSVHNSRIVACCLDCLQQSLVFNLSDLTFSDTPMEVKDLPEDVSYACRFWVEHMCAVTDASKAELFIEGLEDFLQEHLLHWFEAMSILGHSGAISGLLDKLHDWIGISRSNKTSSVRSLLAEASQFSKTYEKSIQGHPLLVYLVAQAFHFPSGFSATTANLNTLPASWKLAPQEAEEGDFVTLTVKICTRRSVSSADGA
ncbi:hypothetical protein PLICRDRAFT_55670 [Plicaturopsis crispa FD-325 SS-3]|nr:hypothetical protein PLICRDRAFT_55670 [Plicaturopsis crispa FD-325 SS-3]